MDCCSVIGRCCGGTALSVFNVLDLAAGTVLVAYGAYSEVVLGKSHDDASAKIIGEAFLAVGLIMVLTVACSFYGMLNSRCKCLLRPSAYMGLLVGLLELGLGIAALAEQGNVHRFLANHQDSLGLSDKELQMTKDWYTICAGGLLVLSLVEILRFYLSLAYLASLNNYFDQYEKLLTHEEEERAAAHVQRRGETREKYERLRAYFRDKYARRSDDDGESRESRSADSIPL